MSGGPSLEGELRQSSGETTGDPGKQDRAAHGIPIIPALDGFRAFAILGIVALHLSGMPGTSGLRVLVFGTLPNMVDVLFIISGFVVFLPTVAQGGRFGSVGAYALRRGARLLPAFWLAIGLVVLMLALWPLQPAPPFPGWVDVGTHLIGAQAIGQLVNPDFNLGLIIDGPLWTLTLELTFYALLPLVAARYFRHPMIGLGIAALITIGWKVGFANLGAILEPFGFRPDPTSLQWLELRSLGQFPAFAFQFALGMTAAWAYVGLRSGDKRPEWLARRAVWAQLLSLIVLGFCAYLFGRFAVGNTLLAPTRARQDVLLTLVLPAAMTVFILATCFAPRLLQMPFALPAARSLGDVSYGIYLIHLPVILFVTALYFPEAPQIGPLGGTLALAIVVLPVVVLYGYLSAHLLEQPIRRWAHRFGRRGQAPATTMETKPATTATSGSGR